MHGWDWESEQLVKEKRKGTAGNGVDPVKDGYYSHRFRPPESSGLEKIPEGKGLLDEITLLRVLIRRVFEAAHGEEDNLETWMKSLQTLGTACTRLAALIKLQKSMKGGEDSELAAVLNRALSEVTQELGMDARFQRVSGSKDV